MNGPASKREAALAWMEHTHDAITRFLEETDGQARFREDAWVRPGGGGGVSRAMADGAVFEKAGVNRSAVDGTLTAGMAERLGGRVVPDGAARFFATGVSVVVHPRSPHVPTVHLNVRYFELASAGGEVLDAWVGGGTDLTPFHPHPEDAVHFHRALRDVCGRHDPALYPRCKSWCDAYFTNTHRAGEARGVGGIFFDNVRDGDEGMSMDALFAYARDVGLCLPEVYGPIVQRRRDQPYGQRERDFQLFRRGRYVEFNLVHDRGTLFGLRTDARIESVLMSLPPLAAWHYDPRWEPGSFEDRFMEMLVPRDWADGVADAPHIAVRAA
jgi:coproporphyrinogen III oxidase